MPDVSTPEKLRDYATNLTEHNGTGLLVSGGSTKEGKVPLTPFLSTLRWIKNNTNLILNIHTGLVNKAEALAISSTGADIVSVDLVGSNKTIKRVYGLNAKFEDYIESMHLLKDAGMNVVPHITIGLDFGEVFGEDNALLAALSLNPEVIVFNALIPTPNTEMAVIKPPNHETILTFFKKANDIASGTQISMGCMRPRKDKSALERASIIAGIHRIALPSNSTVQWLKQQGIKIKIIDSCCAIPVSFEDQALKLI